MTKRLMFLLLVVLLGLPSALSAQTAQNPRLHVLSYNIQMLPRWILHMDHGPVKRAKLIPSVLIADSIDIIVFQEAFDKRCVRILSKLLKPHFPYVVGPANDRKIGIKLNSGVMMFSKVPLKFVDEVDFTECETEDCFARKGALLAEADWHGKPIQILGTHKEAGGSTMLKTGQYLEILGMVRKHTRTGVPQLLCGDFNIRKGSDIYTAMVATFEMQDGDITGEQQFTSDHLINDMSTYRPDDRKIIDFIFYRPNGVEPTFIQREIRRYRTRWSKKHEDLSDHMSILMTLDF